MKHRLFAVLVLALAVPLFAQLNRGTITGTITDPTGAAVPSARVSIRNVETNSSYRVETTGAGAFTMPNLPIGSYEVTIEATGFKRFVRSGLALGVTDVLRVDAKLEIGAIAEVVEVTAQSSLVQTDSPEVSASLSNRNIIDLPLSFSGARSPETFAYKLTPGVTGDSWTSHINGSTSFSKEVLLDGATVSTYLSGHFGESSVSLEAVQEFKVQTSGMSAEFGRTQGGVFNFVMKSGTNNIHGSLYGALRNEALNANTFVNKFRGVKRSQDRKQNVAGSFGGPVYLPKIYDGKDKTFFYFTYERYRERTGGFGAPNRTVPIPDFYEGDFSRLLGAAIPQTDALGRQVLKGAIYDPATFRDAGGGRWVGDMFPGNKIPVSRFSQVSQKLNAIAKAHYLPSVKDASGQWALVNNSVFPVAQTPEFDQHQLSIKGDHNISERQKLSGSYTYVARPRLLLDAGGMWDVSDPEGGPLSKARRQRIKSQLARAAYDWTITPTTLNNLTVYWNRMINPNLGAHRGLDGAKDLGIKSLSTYGYPSINWGGGPFYGLDNPGDPQNDVQVYAGSGLLNTTNFIRGKHYIKVGYDMRFNTLNQRPTQGGSITFAARGTAIPNETFSGSQIGYSFASYLLGVVDSAGLGVPLGIGGRRHYYGLFVQDDFKVTPRLTLNLGLRWDFQPPYFEVANRMAVWNLNKRDPQTGLLGAYDFAGSCQVCTGQRYFGTRDYKDFGPRLGLAWQVAKGWTVRAGYGIFYEADLFDGFSAVPGASTFPWVGSYNLSADSVTPWKGLFNWDNGFPTDRYIPASMDVSYANRSGSAATIDPRYGVGSYNQQWNINLQRELGGGFVLDVGYVGNHGSRLKNKNLERINQLPWDYVTKYGRTLLNPVQNADQAAANGIAYPFAGYRGTVAGALRQFPQLSGVNTFTPYNPPLGSSTYQSLQITVDKRFSRGLTGYINYVWSKNLTNTTSSMDGDNSGPLDYYNLKLEKAPSSYDIPHMFKAFLEYELPVGKGRSFWTSAPRVVNAVVSGWALSTIMNYYDGAPLGFGGASSPLPSGWNGGQRPNVAAGDLRNSAFTKGSFNFANVNSPENQYLNKSLFSDPAALTLGSAAPRYSIIRGFGTISEDIGLMKNSRITEKYRFQIRMEMLNAFNRHQLGGPNTSVTSSQFGQITSVSGSRVIQLGARLDF